MADHQPTTEEIGFWRECFERFFQPDADGNITTENFATKMTEMMVAVHGPTFVTDSAQIQQQLNRMVAEVADSKLDFPEVLVPDDAPSRGPRADPPTGARATDAGAPAADDVLVRLRPQHRR